MFSDVPALAIKARVSSSIFCRTGALAAHATKAKYLKIVLNSSSVVGSIALGLDGFLASFNLTSTSSIPANVKLVWTRIQMLL